MAEMSGAAAIYEILVREGVRYVFGNPGTTELPLMDQFAARDEIEYILALHEDGALGMAAGYADASGKPGVVNLHTNPGVAHALGNLYNAWRAGTPLVVTAGQQDTRAMLEEPLLWGDLVEMTRQYTKWAWEVRTAAEIPMALSRAFRIATTPPTGPVFLSLPVNLTEEMIDTPLPPPSSVAAARVRPDRERLQQAARMLAEARNPAIITGDGCGRSGAVEAVTRLVETLGARAHTEPLNALRDFPTGHRLFAGPLFPNAQQTRAQLEGVDVILTVGVTNLAPLVHTGIRMIPDGARLIQIDADATQLGKNYAAEVAIQADPLAAVEELTAMLETALAGAAEAINKRREMVAAAIAEGRGRFLAMADSPSTDGMISPALVARELRAVAPEDTVVVDEAVTSTFFVRTLFEINRPASYFFAKGGSLGLGLPAAIGAKMAYPDRPVVCTVGDGAALYSIQALWTAARYRQVVVFVVFNNSSYMILKGGMLALKGKAAETGRFPGMDITDPAVDFVRLAESMGVAAQRVTRGEDLRGAFEWAFAAAGPALVDVAISRDIRSVLR